MTRPRVKTLVLNLNLYFLCAISVPERLINILTFCKGQGLPKTLWDFFYLFLLKKKKKKKFQQQRNKRANSLFILSQVIVHHDHDLLIRDAIFVHNLVGMASVSLGEKEINAQRLSAFIII